VSTICKRCGNDRVIRCWDWECFICANDEYCDDALSCTNCVSPDEKHAYDLDAAKLRASGSSATLSLEKWLTDSRELAKREFVTMVQRWRTS
jgi:hypothetical protein